MKAILPRPVLNEADERFKVLHVDRKSIRFALERAGVNASLDDLSWDDFYTLLLRLPELDQEGKHARAVYRALAARIDNDETPTVSMREKFLREGKLWARHKGAADYYRVQDGIYYADDATVPEVITREMCMLDLDRRRGAQKVQRLFGVKPLSYRDIEVKIKKVSEHPRAEHLDAEVERLKPYVYAMRLYSDPHAQGLRRLRALNVRLCRGATGSVRIGNDIHEISVSEGDMILSGDVAYLCSSMSSSPESTGLLLADAFIAHDVGEILARLLGVENGGDFTVLAQCLHGRRCALLQRMLGVDPQPFLNEARQKLKMEPESDMHDAEKFLPRAPATDQQTTTAIEEITDSDSTAISDSAKPRGAIDRVNVKQTEHIPSPPAKQIKKRVRATPCLGRPKAVLRQVTDAKRCQELAYHFEDAEGQDRYPLKIDHLQGSGYYGCDVLSFATSEARANFESTQDVNLVLRFIEVKGRGAEKGPIELKGNELTSALKYHDRFYVYRVFEVKDDLFEVAVLKDPTAGSPKVIYEIDLFREPGTARYEVIEVS